jgi:EmrB/QacA subfamily drug resistance transporter
MHDTRKGSILLATTLASFLTAFMGSALNVALPTLGQQFSMDAVTLGWVATAYTLAIAIFLVPFGRAADIGGRRRVFTIGLISYVLITGLAALAPSGNLLLVLRVLQGVAAAAMFATSSAILSSAYPPGQRGRVLGINVSSVYIGLSVGPFLGGVLAQHFGWQSVFWASALLGVVAVIAALRVTDEWAESRGERFDWAGAVIYGLALAAAMYGLSQLPTGAGGILLAAGLAGLVGFGAWATRVPSPILDISLFRTNRTFTFSSLAALINYLATTAVAFLLSLYLQYLKGFSPEQAGLLLVLQPAMQAIFSPLAGRLSDRIESRVVASAGMALTAVGLAMLAFLTAATPLAYIAAALLLLGVGFGFFSSPNMNAIMGSVDKRLYGVSSALLATMRTIGQTLSLTVTLLLFTIIIGPVEMTEQYYGGFLVATRLAFAIFAGLCIVGIFLSLARGKVLQSEPPVKEGAQ